MAKKTPAIRISLRDVHALNGIGTYGILSTTDIKEMYFAEQTERACRKRLRLFALHNLTRSTKLAVSFADSGRGGSIPSLHTLTEQGADVVESQMLVRPPRILRSSPSPFTFLHRMEIVRVVRQFNTGCEAVGLPAPDWIMEQDPWPDAPPQSPPNQRRLLYHAFHNGRETFTAQPDIASRFTTGTTEVVVFWEIDRATEGHKQIRNNKLDGHVALINEFLSGSNRRYWSDCTSKLAFVFWVCPSRKRISEICSTVADHPAAPLYRFASRDALEAPRSLLCDKVWSTVTGERRALYSPSGR